MRIVDSHTLIITSSGSADHAPLVYLSINSPITSGSLYA